MNSLEEQFKKYYQINELFGMGIREIVLEPKAYSDLLLVYGMLRYFDPIDTGFTQMTFMMPNGRLIIKHV
jgi:hypothetical protein